MGFCININGEEKEIICEDNLTIQGKCDAPKYPNIVYTGEVFLDGRKMHVFKEQITGRIIWGEIEDGQDFVVGKEYETRSASL